MKRGELGSLGKLRSNEWVVECAACREVDPFSERAAAARKWAVEKDADPEELIERMRDLAPPELRRRSRICSSSIVAAREGD